MSNEVLQSKKIQKMGVLYLGYRGGGAVVTESFCREMIEAGYDIFVLLSKWNEILPNFKKICPGKVIEFDVPMTHLKALNIFLVVKCFFKTKKTLKREGIKNILIPMHHPYTVLMIPFLRLSGIHVISGIHDFIPHDGDKRVLLEIANSLIIFFSSTVLFFSNNQLKSAIKRYRGFGSKFTKVRLANDFLRTAKFSKPKNPSYDFIFFGRLEPYKGIARLKEAWGFVLKENPDATLLIRGKGPVSVELLALKEMKGVDIDIGYVANASVEDLMKDVKVILAPYDSATQSGITGIAATFAMLVVATPCEGFIEQVQYNNRIVLAKDFESTSFAKAMLDARKAWNWSLLHEDLKITTGFVDDFLKTHY